MAQKQTLWGGWRTRITRQGWLCQALGKLERLTSWLGGRPVTSRLTPRQAALGIERFEERVTPTVADVANLDAVRLPTVNTDLNWGMDGATGLGKADSNPVAEWSGAMELPSAMVFSADPNAEGNEWLLAGKELAHAIGGQVVASTLDAGLGGHSSRFWWASGSALARLAQPEAAWTTISGGAGLTVLAPGDASALAVTETLLGRPEVSSIQLVGKASSLARDASLSGVVVIDAGLLGQIPVLSGSLVIPINPDEDAIAQITSAMDGLREIPVVRVISHGSDGTLWFGSQRIDSSVLGQRSAEIASWGLALSEDAEMLLYGCSVASTTIGATFANLFASITGSDVGASINPTGALNDLDLEYKTGLVKSTIKGSQADYLREKIVLETSGEYISAFTNHMNGYATVTFNYDVSGLNGEQTMVLYLKRAGEASYTNVAEKSGQTNGNNRTISAYVRLNVGTNNFRASYRGGPVDWGNAAPCVISAPVFISGQSSVSTPVLNGFGGAWYGASGTGGYSYSAIGLPSGMALRSDGLLYGTPASGTAGSYNPTLQVTNGFATDTWTISLNITKLDPIITWSNPANIIYGTALSSTQLNATSNNPENASLAYSPVSGTVLNAGVQNLTATGVSTTNYNAVSKTVSITVLPVVSITGISPDTGTSSTDYLTSSTTPTVSGTVGGTGGAATTVDIYEGATKLVTTTANAAGAWSAVLPARSTGAHTIFARATVSGASADSANQSITIDPNGPVVNSVTAPANGNYNTGSALNFTLVMNESVVVTGSPRLGITIGGTKRYLAYSSGSGSANLVFSYTPTGSDADSDGPVLDAALELNGGTIQDNAGNSMASLSLSGVPTITGITINQAPIAVNDIGSATEAGGIANATTGSDATGNVLANDTYLGTATLTVTSLRLGNVEGSGTAGTVGAALVGTYGTLTLNSDGSFTYQVDQNNATVQALASGATLTESFNYTTGNTPPCWQSPSPGLMMRQALHLWLDSPEPCKIFH
ncbi:MAG: DUF4347 domain-containing protein [Gemmataceae bacterium]|nr:DUF4347 domain-containing protein [Gemmataceae bacterium]